MRRISDFVQDIDHRWTGTAAVKIRLRIIGSAALMLQTDYERGTKDSDVLETAQLTPEIRDLLRTLAGKGTPLHARHRLYIDIVSSGLPFLPQVPVCHELIALNRSLRCLEIEVLDVDVVVSKLKRFNANDISDIEAMVDREMVPHPSLIDRFRSAADAFQMDARASELPAYVRALHRVERDFFGVPETVIDLPGWI